MSTQPQSRVNSDEALSQKFGTQENDTENASVFIGLAWQQSQSERNEMLVVIDTMRATQEIQTNAISHIVNIESVFWHGLEAQILH